MSGDCTAIPIGYDDYMLIVGALEMTKAWLESGNAKMAGINLDFAYDRLTKGPRCEK